MMKANPFMRMLGFLLLALIVFIYMFPLMYLVNVALKTPTDFLMNPSALTKHFDLHNFVNAWSRASVGKYLFNSVYYTASVTIISLLLALLAAFPISRKYTRGANVWYVFFLIGIFLPSGLIPQFQLMLRLGLFNNPLSFILTNINFVMIFILMVGYFKSLPADLDHAASVDGCGYFRFLFTIVLPLIMPVVATGAILISIGAWNNIIGAVIYLSDKSLYPVVLGLFVFYGSYSNEWTVLSAAIIIIALPLVVLYLSLQKYFIQGALSGAVKA